MAELTSARIDAWLWAVRVFKTRSAATTACRAGHVRLNGDRAKAAALVRPGDEIRVRTGEGDRTVIVQRLLVKRVGAPVAQEAMIDRTPPPVPREERASVGERDRGSGRPTKRDRREIERLRGH